MRIVMIHLFLLIIFVSCSNDESKNERYSNSKNAVAAVAESEAMDAELPAQASDKVVSIESKIIKTSNLRFETDNNQESYLEIEKLIAKYNATIQNDIIGKDYSSSYRNITIRVDSKNFTPFLNDISKGVKYFDRKEISSQDVTEQYIDLEARMNAKKNLEKRYLEILSKPNKVSEILEIEKQLAVIREEIEAKEGQLKYLKSQIALSTINIEMYTNNASESGVTVSYPAKIWNAIQSGFNGLSSFILGLITIWPFILILAIIIIVIRRKFYKKKTN